LGHWVGESGRPRLRFLMLRCFNDHRTSGGRLSAPRMNTESDCFPYPVGVIDNSPAF
jgi:hypothetical protein